MTLNSSQTCCYNKKTILLKRGTEQNIFSAGGSDTLVSYLCCTFILNLCVTKSETSSVVRGTDLFFQANLKSSLGPCRAEELKRRSNWAHSRGMMGKQKKGMFCILVSGWQRSFVCLLSNGPITRLIGTHTIIRWKLSIMCVMGSSWYSWGGGGPQCENQRCKKVHFCPKQDVFCHRNYYWLLFQIMFLCMSWIKWSPNQCFYGYLCGRTDEVELRLIVCNDGPPSVKLQR